jgi:hypothetical protein
METSLSFVSHLVDNRVSSPKNIIWMQDWGRYGLFNEGMMYTSADGITWEGVQQVGFTTAQYKMFDGAIYIPGDEFYVKGNGYVYYAAY